MRESSEQGPAYGLAFDGDESGGPAFDSLAEAAHAAVQAVGPDGRHYTALVIRFGRGDPETPFGSRRFNVLARVSRVDEHGSPTQAP